MRYQSQRSFNDCGPACLVMLASHYQIPVDLTDLRRLCGMRFQGTNLKRLLSAAEKLGFQAQAFKGSIDEASLYTLPSPCMAHVTFSWLGIKIKHYVVVAHRTEHHIEIGDPNQKVGVKKISNTEFLRIWTGYILIITLLDGSRSDFNE